MKVSREQAAKNRAHVVEVAGAEFRTHGFDGIGIADLMKAAGLTHGGFYANFASKEDLAAEAARRALLDTTAPLRELMRTENPLEGMVKTYLSEEHRDNPGHGCVLAALAPDAARAGDKLRAVFEGGVQQYLDILTPLMRAETEDERRRQAMSTLVSLVGALVLARTVTSPELSRELLAAGARNTLSTPADDPLNHI